MSTQTEVIKRPKRAEISPISVAVTLAVVLASVLAYNLGLSTNKKTGAPRRVPPTPRPAIYLPDADACRTLSGNPELAIEARKNPANSKIDIYCARFNVSIPEIQ